MMFWPKVMAKLYAISFNVFDRFCGPRSVRTGGPRSRKTSNPRACTVRRRPRAGVGRLGITNHLQLALGLPLRNRPAFTNLLNQLYNPASQNYRRHLTPEQFVEQFGPTEQDYQAAIAFARAHGLRVTGTHPNRKILNVTGVVADVEKAFQVKLHVYPHPQETRTFFAPDGEPSLDLQVPVLHIGGLNNHSRPRPRSQRVPFPRPCRQPSTPPH